MGKCVPSEPAHASSAVFGRVKDKPLRGPLRGSLTRPRLPRFPEFAFDAPKRSPATPEGPPPAPIFRSVHFATNPDMRTTRHALHVARCHRRSTGARVRPGQRSRSDGRRPLAVDADAAPITIWIRPPRGGLCPSEVIAARGLTCTPTSYVQVSSKGPNPAALVGSVRVADTAQGSPNLLPRVWFAGYTTPARRISPVALVLWRRSRRCTHLVLCAAPPEVGAGTDLSAAGARSQSRRWEPPALTGVHRRVSPGASRLS